VQNGDTIVLGGLIKESRINTRTKVPFLGDMPILGMLFKKNSDSTTRKNLLIFVTASIISPEGEELK
jgi:type IV pilus assembly protein PilQ